MADVNSSCNSCGKLKEALEVSKKEHSLTLKMVKEKIISTDELIKKYQQKCLESEKHLQQASDNTSKLEAAQMKMDSLQSQLERSLQSTEPLRKNAVRLHREKSLADSTILELQEKLQKLEKLNSELMTTMKLKEEQECAWRLEKQVQAQEVQKQKKSLEKSESTISKLQEQLKKEKEQYKDLNRSLTQANKKTAKLERQLEEAKDGIESMKLEVEIVRGCNGAKESFRPRMKRKGRQPTKPHRETKQPSPPVSYSKQRIAHVIRELSDLSDMETALSPLPPSPDRHSVEMNSSSEESEDEARADDSDSSLGDLAEMIMGDKTQPGESPKSPSNSAIDTSNCEEENDVQIAENGVTNNVAFEDGKIEFVESEEATKSIVDVSGDYEEFEHQTSKDPGKKNGNSDSGETDRRQTLSDLTTKAEDGAAVDGKVIESENCIPSSEENINSGCGEISANGEIESSIPSSEQKITENDAVIDGMEINSKDFKLSETKDGNSDCQRAKGLKSLSKSSEVSGSDQDISANGETKLVEFLCETRKRLVDHVVDEDVKIENTDVEESMKNVDKLVKGEMEHSQPLTQLPKITSMNDLEKAGSDNIKDCIQKGRLANCGEMTCEEISPENGSLPNSTKSNTENEVTKQNIVSKQDTVVSEVEKSPITGRKSSRLTNANKKDETFGSVEPTACKSKISEVGLSPSPKRNGECVVTSPTSRIMTRSRTKAMRLSASSGDESGSEKTGNDLNSNPDCLSDASHHELKRSGVDRNTKNSKIDDRCKDIRVSLKRQAQDSDVELFCHDVLNTECPVHLEDSISRAVENVSTEELTVSFANSNENYKLVNGDEGQESEIGNLVCSVKPIVKVNNSVELMSRDSGDFAVKSVNDLQKTAKTMDEQISSQEKDFPSVRETSTQNKEALRETKQRCLEENSNNKNKFLESFENETDHFKLDFASSLRATPSVHETRIVSGPETERCSILDNSSANYCANDIIEEPARNVVQIEFESIDTGGMTDGKLAANTHSDKAGLKCSLVEKTTSSVYSEIKEDKAQLSVEMFSPNLSLSSKGEESNCEGQDLKLHQENETPQFSLLADTTPLSETAPQSEAEERKPGNLDDSVAKKDISSKFDESEGVVSYGVCEMFADDSRVNLPTVLSIPESLEEINKNSTEGNNVASSLKNVDTLEMNLGNASDRDAITAKSVSLMDKDENECFKDNNFASAEEIEIASELNPDDLINKETAEFSNETSVFAVEHSSNQEEKSIVTCNDAEISFSSNEASEHFSAKDSPVFISKAEEQTSVSCILQEESGVKTNEASQLCVLEFSTFNERKTCYRVETSAEIGELDSIASLRLNRESTDEDNYYSSVHVKDNLQNTKGSLQDSLTAHTAMLELEERIGDQFLTLSPLPPSPSPSDEESPAFGDPSFSDLPPLSPLPPSPRALIDEIALLSPVLTSTVTNQTPMDRRELGPVCKASSPTQPRNLSLNDTNMPLKSVKRKASLEDVSVGVKKADNRAFTCSRNMAASGEKCTFKRSLQEMCCQSAKFNVSLLASRCKRIRTRQNSKFSEGETLPPDVCPGTQSRNNSNFDGPMLRKAFNIRICDAPKTEKAVNVGKTIKPMMPRRSSNVVPKTGPTAVRQATNVGTDSGSMMAEKCSKISSSTGLMKGQPAKVAPKTSPTLVEQAIDNGTNGRMVQQCSNIATSTGPVKGQPTKIETTSCEPMLGKQSSNISADTDSVVVRQSAQLSNTHSERTDVDNPTEGEVSKYRPLAVRYKALAEVKYARKCLNRLYEDSVEIKVVVERLGAKRCISSCTPLSSAIINFLKTREDDLMAVIQDRLDKKQELQEWKPVLTSFEERLLQVITQLAESYPMFGNFVSQLVNLCCRGVITGNYNASDDSFKGALSLCRVLTSLCHLKEDIACARVVCYDIMRSLHASQQTALELVVAMVTVWPELLPTSSDWWSSDIFPLAKTPQFVLLYWATSCSSDHGRVLRRLYRWENDLKFTSETLKELGARLSNKLNDQSLSDVCIGEDGSLAMDRHSFELIKSLELLSCVLGWRWSLDIVIIDNIWRVLQTWTERTVEANATRSETVKGEESNCNETNTTACFCHTPRVGISSQEKHMGGEGGENDQGGEAEQCHEVCPKCGRLRRQKLVESHVVVCVQLLGGLCKIAIENRQTIVPEIMDLLCGLLEEQRSPNSKVTYAIQLAAAMSLLDMSPWQPERVVCALGKWLSDVNNSHSLQAPSCVKEGLMCLMMSDQSKNDMAVT